MVWGEYLFYGGLVLWCCGWAKMWNTLYGRGKKWDLGCLGVVTTILTVYLLFSNYSFELTSSISRLVSPISPRNSSTRVRGTLSSCTNKNFGLGSPVDNGFATTCGLFSTSNSSRGRTIIFCRPSRRPNELSVTIVSGGSNG